MVSEIASDTFPRQYARTQRFTLGAPRNLSVVADDTTLLFLRSTAGNDPVNRLWRRDLTGGIEAVVADPPDLLAAGSADADDLPPEDESAYRWYRGQPLPDLSKLPPNRWPRLQDPLPQRDE